jgi:hypothetical protein
MAAGPRSLRRTKRGSAHVANHDEWARARQGRCDGADAVLASRCGRLATRSPYGAECDRSKPGDDKCGADREEEFEYESRRKQTFSERLTLGESFAHFQEQEQKELRGHKPCQEGQPEGAKGGSRAACAPPSRCQRPEQEHDQENQDRLQDDGDGRAPCVIQARPRVLALVEHPVRDPVPTERAEQDAARPQQPPRLGGHADSIQRLWRAVKGGQDRRASEMYALAIGPVDALRDPA